MLAEGSAGVADIQSEAGPGSGCGLAAVAAAAALVWWERRAADPVLELRLLTGRVRAGLAGALAGYLVLFGPLCSTRRR